MLWGHKMLKTYGWYYKISPGRKKMKNMFPIPLKLFDRNERMILANLPLSWSLNYDYNVRCQLA